jgi:tetratricopeptide (TPR) repeat protein
LRPLLERDAAALDERDTETLVETMAAWGKAAAAAGQPMVLLLDDAEAADELSRAVLRRVMLHPAAPPALWVWARRSSAAEAPEDERLLVASGRAEALGLAALAREDTMRLVSERLGEPAPVALVERVWDLSGGHPGLIVQLLLAAARDGVLLEADTGLTIGSAALAALRAPRDFEDALLERLAGLGEAERAAALGLAIIGRAATARELEALDARASEAARGALLGAGLARRAGAGGYQLVPPALATRLLESLPDSERAALHRAALGLGTLPPRESFVHARAAGDRVRALEDAEVAWRADGDPQLAADAAAYLEAFDPIRAAEWYERAADVLRSRGLYARAIACLEPAVRLDDRVAERARRTAYLVTSHLRCGNFAQAESLATRALEESVPDEWRVRLVTDRAHTLMSRGRGVSRAEITTMLEGAVELGKRAGNTKNLIGAYLTLATAYLDEGRSEDAAKAARAVLELAEEKHDESGVVRAMLMQSNIEFHAGHLEGADALQREAIAKARSHSLRVELQQALSARPAVASSLGNWVEARLTAAESLRFQLEDERVEEAGVALANVAVLDALTGHPRIALRRAARAVRLCREFSPRNEGFAFNVVAQCLRLSGERQRALAAVRRATTSQAFGRTGSPWVRIEYGRCCAAMGRRVEARRCGRKVTAGGVVRRTSVMRALAGGGASTRQAHRRRGSFG